MIRIFRTFRDHKEELKRCDWQKQRLETLSGRVAKTRHNIRNLLSVPDLVQWYTKLIDYEHFDESSIFTGKFAKEHMMNVHGRVSNNMNICTILMYQNYTHTDANDPAHEGLGVRRDRFIWHPLSKSPRDFGPSTACFTI